MTRRAGLPGLFLMLAWLAARAAVASDCEAPPGYAPLPALALQPVVGGLKEPVYLTHAGDGSGRLYVAEQAGVVRIIENGRLRPRPFLDIRGRVRSGGEKGLLGLAFHPRFAANGWFYVNYTEQRGSALWTVISRFHALDARHADVTSERRLLEVRQPFANHNGGQLAFGPDGFLYVGLGDGGGANDPRGNGQNPATLLGSVLRLNVDAGDRLHGIPPDNPFVGQADHRAEIWAYGFRNPWRFSFDRGSGRLFLADVGQDRVEEIDVVERGGNYGWNVMEGDLCLDGSRDCARDGLIMPIFTYRHPQGFAISGGYVYRGRAVAGLCGAYVYADYVEGKVWGLRYNGKRVMRHGLLLDTPYFISSFGEDEAGELYLLAHQRGRVFRLISPGLPPQGEG
ncbi:MAG TPA: glucose dehydrogenase [Gammaproteobacteria bacterium]|nr:glucose dehydrogenase [Gammaproteobacteria bacterium]